MNISNRVSALDDRMATVSPFASKTVMKYAAGGRTSRSKKAMTKLALPKHQFIRELSPQERALPKEFTMRKEVAYLFEN